MKTIKNISFRVMAVLAVALVCTLPAKAQLSNNGFASVDWQFNVPLSNGFANDASGWGMNFEGGYFITPNVALGGFLSYHSNHEYISRQTLPVSDDGAVTTDQQHTLFQLPFGGMARYQFNRGSSFQPYVGFKLGANYAKIRSDYNVFESYDDSWGVHVSPEVGLNYFPWAYGPGLHAAVYYNYNSNKSSLIEYNVNGLNNFGFRLGVSF